MRAEPTVGWQPEATAPANQWVIVWRRSMFVWGEAAVAMFDQDTERWITRRVEGSGLQTWDEFVPFSGVEKWTALPERD